MGTVGENGEINEKRRKLSEQASGVKTRIAH